MFGGASAAPHAAAWKRDSRHRFLHLAVECVRREVISRRKFDELRRSVGVSDKDAEALLEAARPSERSGRARERARESRD
jgi:hypothetical protein